MIVRILPSKASINALTLKASVQTMSSESLKASINTDVLFPGDTLEIKVENLKKNDKVDFEKVDVDVMAQLTMRGVKRARRKLFLWIFFKKNKNLN